VKERHDCLDFCCKVLNESKSHYALWFSLLTLEQKVKRRWNSLQDPLRKEYRDFLWRYLMENNFLPKHFVTKIAKVLVEIAKVDFPEHDQSFFRNVKDLCLNQDTLISNVGLQVLLTSVEEFVAYSSSLSLPDGKANVLRAMIMDDVQDVLKVLDSVLDRTRTSGDWESPLGLCALQILQHLVANVESTHEFEGERIRLLFAIIANFHTGMGVQALACLNEMFERNLIPKEEREFVGQVALNTLQVMEFLVAISPDGRAKNLDGAASGFCNQYTRFLNVFFRRYLAAVERHESIPFSRLLEILSEYTLAQCYDFEEFIFSTEPWQYVVLVLKDEQGDEQRVQKTMQYSDVLMRFVSSVFKLVQWEHSVSVLEILDNEPVSAAALQRNLEVSEKVYDMSDYDRFISSAIGLMMEITLLPSPDTSPGFQNLFHECGGILSQRLSSMGPILRGESGAEMNDGLAQKVADATTMFELLSSAAVWTASPVWFGQMFDATFQVLKISIEVLQSSNRLKLYHSGADLKSLHVSAMKNVASLGSWLRRVGMLSDKVLVSQGEMMQQSDTSLMEKINPSEGGYLVQNFDEAMCQILDRAFESLDSSISPPPEAVCDAAVVLFASIGNRVVPKRFLEYGNVKTLCEKLKEISSTLPGSSNVQLVVAVSNSFLEQMEKRTLKETRGPFSEMISVSYSQVISPFVEKLVNVASKRSRRCSNELLSCRPMLGILTALSDSVKFRATHVRGIAVGVLTRSLDPAIELIEALLKDAQQNWGGRPNGNSSRHVTSFSTIREAVGLVLSLLDSLRREIGDKRVAETQSILIGMFTERRTFEAVIDGGHGAIPLLLELLKLLIIFAQDSSTREESQWKLMSLCFEVLPPAISTLLNSSRESQNSFGIDLLDTHYEFVCVLLRSAKPPEKFLWMAMKLFLDSFEKRGIPPSTLRRNLLTLQDFDAVFAQSFELRRAFLLTLLKQFVMKSHQIIEEEIVQVTYSLAKLNFHEFQSQVLPAFLVEFRASNGLAAIGGDENWFIQEFSQSFHREIRDKLEFKTSMQSFAGNLLYIVLVNDPISANSDSNSRAA